jgi:hypothetical protein
MGSTVVRWPRDGAYKKTASGPAVRRGVHGNGAESTASQGAGRWEGARWPWEGARGARTPRVGTAWRVRAGRRAGAGAFCLESVSVCPCLTVFFSRFLT